jgi:hypothetical protein
MNALVRAGVMPGRVWSDLCQCDSVSWLAAWQARLHRWLTQLTHRSLAHAIRLREDGASFRYLVRFGVAFVL